MNALPKLITPQVSEILKKDRWVDAKKELPKFIEGEDYSRNVLAVCNGALFVMCLCYIPGDEGGFAWANCYGDIYGDWDFDDDYEVTHWQHLPSLPTLEVWR